MGSDIVLLCRCLRLIGTVPYGTETKHSIPTHSRGTVDKGSSFPTYPYGVFRLETEPEARGYIRGKRLSQRLVAKPEAKGKVSGKRLN